MGPVTQPTLHIHCTYSPVRSGYVSLSIFLSSWKEFSESSWPLDYQICFYVPILSHMLGIVLVSWDANGGQLRVRPSEIILLLLLWLRQGVTPPQISWGTGSWSSSRRFRDKTSHGFLDFGCRFFQSVITCWAILIYGSHHFPAWNATKWLPKQQNPGNNVHFFKQQFLLL